MYYLDSKLLRSTLEDIFQKKIEKLQPIGGIQVNYTATFMMRDRRYFLKAMVRPPGDELEHKRFEKVALIYRRLEDIDVFMPDILYKDTITRQIGERTVYALLVIEYFPFKVLSEVWSAMNSQDRGIFAIKLAKLVKTIHSIDFNGFGKSGFYTGKLNQNWTGFLLEEMTKQRTLLENNEYVNQNLVDVSVEIIRKHPEMWEYSGSPVLCHQDLWHGNILINPENYNEFFIIDWEWADILDPVMDLLWINELFPGKNTYSEPFFETYGFDENKNSAKIKIYNVYKSLENAGSGFLYHNPSEEGYKAFHDRLTDFIEGYRNDHL